MIIYYKEMIQGSEAWHSIRCGLPTASEMKLLVTPTLKVAEDVVLCLDLATGLTTGQPGGYAKLKTLFGYAPVCVSAQSDAGVGRAVSGVFARWRWTLVWLTQLVFYGLPWLNWNDRPAVLFDLGARRFYIFGLVLYPQDFIYLTALLVTLKGLPGGAVLAERAAISRVTLAKVEKVEAKKLPIL